MVTKTNQVLQKGKVLHYMGHWDYNDDIRQEQMWEMQVLSNQRNGEKGEEVDRNPNSGTPEFTTDERLGTENLGESGTQSSQDSEHPALRGIQSSESVSTSTTEKVILGTSVNNQSSSTDELSVSNDVIPQNLANVGGRKRPLLAVGSRSTMTPTKRTVMSLLAKARAAQAKHLTSSLSRTTPERPPTLVPLLREDYITGGVNLSLI